MTGVTPGTGPTVAVVDDEEDITTFLRLALEDAGYGVVTTNDATAALDLLLASRPDLILLDLLMPERSGLSLYAAMRARPELGRIPTVILSGLGIAEELPELLRRAGGLPPPDGFLEKPLDAEQLLVKVKQLLGLPEGGAR